MGLSLWLVPTPSQSSSLSRIMHVRHPHFHPHVTLATVPSQTPLPTLLSSIPPSQPAIRAPFAALHTGDVYFRSVYIAIVPSAELVRLHAHIRDSLGIDELRDRAFPHMSVYYIDHAQADERVRVAQELLANGTVMQDPSGDGIIVDCSKCPRGSTHEPNAPDLLNGFDGIEIWAVSCDGPVETWSILEKVQLLTANEIQVNYICHE